MNETVNLAAPLMQFGFAGFCIVLLAFIFWLVKRLLGVLDQTNRIIAANTEAILNLSNTTTEEMKLVRDLRDKMMTRPCLGERESRP